MPVVVCQAQAEGASPNPAAAPGKNDVKQINVNQDVLLLNGSKEENRIEAATYLLDHKNPLARKILLDIINKQDNAAAFAVICKELSRRRTEGTLLENKGDFLNPLVGAVQNPDQTIAKLASQSLLVFNYDVVGPALEPIVNDGAKSEVARLNAMHALQLQPDMKASITILGLVDDGNDKISKAATEILHLTGIPVGNNFWDRGRIREELNSKSKDEFLRDWLVTQESRMRAEQEQTAMWKNLCLEMIGKLYITVNDDKTRTAFLLEHLQSPQASRKLWALKRVYEWRLEPGTVPLDTLAPAVVGSISDRDSSVRLEAAKLLSYMGRIESAQRILDQLKAELEQEVKTELFVALGVACKAALMRDGIPVGIKTNTLKWAAEFLENAKAKESAKGAEVIGLLLEKNGLSPQEMESHLELLILRYQKIKSGNSALQSDLLRIMAGLCSNRSACKEEGRKLFKPIFEDAAQNENERVREEAVNGLISIGKLSALKKLRADMTNDASARIRQHALSLAEETGGAEDVSWLIEKIESGRDTDSACKSLHAIMKRSDVAVIEQWLDRLIAIRKQERLSGDQWLGLLEVAAGKLVAKKGRAEKICREKIQLLTKRSDHKAVAAELKKLAVLDKNGLNEAHSALLIDCLIRQGLVTETSDVLLGLLKKSDLVEQGEIARVLMMHAPGEGKEGAASKTARTAMNNVKIVATRPVWEKIKAALLAKPEQDKPGTKAKSAEKASQ